MEAGKRSEWQRDNVLRRHDFIPLVLALMRKMAQKKKLLELYASAKERRTAVTEATTQK